MRLLLNTAALNRVVGRYGLCFTVTEHRGCRGCVFYTGDTNFRCMRFLPIEQQEHYGISLGSVREWGPCSAFERSDETSIIFKPNPDTKKWLKLNKMIMRLEQDD